MSHKRFLQFLREFLRLWVRLPRRCLAAGADAVFDKSTEIDEFTTYAINEVERVAGETRY